MPPQVAVGDDAGQKPVRIGNTDHAKAVAADFDQRFAHAHAFGHQRRVWVHQVADLQEPGAQLSAGVEQAKMVGRKGAVFHQRNGQGVAQRQCHRGRGGGHDPGFTGFGHLGQQKAHIRLPHQG